MKQTLLNFRPKRFNSDASFNLAILLPAVFLCGSVFLYPAFLAIRTSITGPDGAASLVYYVHLFSDELFGESLSRTFLFAGISVSLEFALGLAMALLLIIPVRGRGFFRTSALVPWVLPPAVMGFAWRWIFYEDYGIVNDLILRTGVIDSPIPFLRDPHWAFATLVFADTWKTAPFIGIILLAGLAVIPRELYEAAAIDGAGRVRRFFLVTLPLLTPYILTALLFRTVQTIGIFDLVWVVTGGGPSSSTEMVSLYITKQTFRFLNVGYGTALSAVLFIIALVVAATISFFSRRRFQWTDQ